MTQTERFPLTGSLPSLGEDEESRERFVAALERKLEGFVAPDHRRGGFVGKFLDRGGAIYNVKSFGAKGDGVADDTTAIQAAIDVAAAAGGGIVFIPPRGTYLLNEVGANPYANGHRYCLDITGDNVVLYLGPGVTLKLADSQQTDANGPVDLIVFRDRSNIAVIGAGSGLSRITGNTAGQTGWSGGYAQADNGLIISGYTSSGGLRDVLVQGLQLDDHFSNPVYLGSSTARSKRCYIKSCYGFDCGEGFLLEDIDDCAIIDVTYEDPSNVAVGDAVEISGCTLFTISSIRVAQNGTGGGIDIFGSQKGTVSDFVIDGWDQGIQMGTKSGTVVDEVSVANGVIRNCTNTSTILAVGDGVIAYENIQVLNNAGIGLLADGGASLAPVSLVGCIFDGNKPNIRVTDRKVVLNGGSVINSQATSDGIDCTGSTGELHAVGVRIGDNNRYGIASVGNLAAALIEGCDFRGNGTSTINGLPSANIVVRNCLPDVQSAANIGGIAVVGLSRTVIQTGAGSTITGLQGASDGQVLTIRVATGGSCTVNDKSTSGNLNLKGSANFAMTADQTLTLLYDAGVAQWFEISRSTN